MVRHPHVITCGQLVDVEEPGIEPLPVRLLGCQLGLDLLIGDDPALRGVDEEHPARLETHLLDDGGGVEVEDTGLRCHHHQTVAGHPDPRRTQTVTVEHRADDSAVGEADRGRSVPRLHQRGVVLVERPAGRVHRFVALPGLRNHHQHGVGQTAATEVQQLEHLVEARGVRRAGRADRDDLLEILAFAEDIGPDQGFAGPHPVLVAGDGVDLPVVGDPAERVCQRPGRERVGGEPRVHDPQRAGEALVLQVEVERLQLRRRQHPLVDERLTGKTWEVDRFPARPVLTGPLGAEFVFGAFAHHIGAPLEFHPLRATDEQLAEGRHGVTGERTERRIVGGHIAPTEHLQTLGLGDLADRLTRDRGVLGRLRQERDAGGVTARLGELEAFVLANGPEILVGHLQQDARPVAGVRLSALGTAMFEVQQGRDGLVDDVAAAATVHVGHHRHTARIVLERGVVEPLRM